MRLFKNRGDIYFSKVNKKKSKEQEILLIALVIIVIFTILFVGVLCITNDFSAKKFFEPDNISETSQISHNSEEELILPEMEGKTNFATLVYDNNTLLFTALIQSDLDNKAFKVSILKGDTQLDSTTLSSIFSTAGAENVVSAIKTQLGVDFDYYISISSNDYQSFFDKLGHINYPILYDIRYKETKSPVTYTLKIKAGEQSIDGKHFVNLIRYYSEVENNLSQANELMLAALAQQLNEKNMAEGESLFKSFVMMADTNISVRDFSLAGDKLTVISNEQSAMGVYNAPVSYDGNKISDEGLKKVKGYFVK